MYPRGPIGQGDGVLFRRMRVRLAPRVLGVLAQRKSAGPTNRRSLGQHQHTPLAASSEVERDPDKVEAVGSIPTPPTEEWPSGLWRWSRKPEVERSVGSTPTSSLEGWPNGKAAVCYTAGRKPVRVQLALLPQLDFGLG